MADAPDLGSGGAILRGSSPLPGSLSEDGRTALRLAAVLKEKHLGSSIRKVKANGAIAADQVARDAATGARAVDLMNANVDADVKLAPCFDEDGALRLVGKEKFHLRAAVFHVGDRRGGFE